MEDWILNSSICSEVLTCRWLKLCTGAVCDLTVPDFIWWSPKRPEVGGYLLLILQSDMVCKTWPNMKHFPHFNLSVLWFCHTSQMQVCDLLLSLITQVNFPFGWVLLFSSVIYSCSEKKKLLSVCSFQRKKSAILIPFHPTRGGSLKVIFSSSSGLGFALSRTREESAFTVSSLYCLILGKKGSRQILALTKQIFAKNTAFVKYWKKWVCLEDFLFRERRT